ncbi:Imm1 family immunity protein [Plantactinospora solaniradicis]|uniref:Imm1 family immunity protein n=1 Tax=Plantactinospora solaniradicis TaxID=1723736 RepID=A0ABW1KMY4_9ACTN
MSRYIVTWGLDEQADDTYRVIVGNVDELDRVLDTIERTSDDDNAAYVVTILAEDDPDAHRAIQIGVGRSDRGFLLYLGEDGGYGYEPGLSPWPETVVFDYNGEATEYKPARTRITPAVVRAAARGYLTATRPQTIAIDPNA